MNINVIRCCLYSANDPFDIYEIFVLNTDGSPQEQVEIWKKHLGVDEVLDMYIQIALHIRDYCNKKRNIDIKINALWNNLIGISDGVPTTVVDLT